MPRYGSQGTVVRVPARDLLSITAFGISWICDHVPWPEGVGAILLPVTTDAALVVDNVSSDTDLEEADDQRRRDALQAMLEAADLRGAQVQTATLHECTRNTRAFVYVARTRLAWRPRAGDAAGAGDALDATVSFGTPEAAEAAGTGEARGARVLTSSTRREASDAEHRRVPQVRDLRTSD
jgi:hypothetical protein